MDTLVCKHCHQISSVTPSTEYVRCHGCQRLLSVGRTKDIVFYTKDEVAYRGCISWRLGLERKKIEAKMFCNEMRSRFLGSNSIQQIQNGISLVPCITTLDPPRRGKRALLCGVTYKKQKRELKGSAHDVKNMRDLLVGQYRFPAESILILAEEESYRPPTRKNIEYGFQWLMKGIQPGDSLVFYFSGHGLRERDFNGDEIDGFDETICPLDFETNGMILDNYINKAIVLPLILGVTLHAIIDSCHSGTALDLPYVYNIDTGKWDDNKPPSGTYKGTSGGTAICFSACEDYQLAADTSVLSQEKQYTGAMTSTFIKAIKEAHDNKQKITYRGLLDSMNRTIKQAHKSGGGLFAGLRRAFHRRILQDPQLSSSEQFDTSKEFKL
ncbi:Metacaspase involved in regulation of apoptosis [Handroanthus impetiginosus]|uniref:Metacaspase involved in regulation of apoptosis n=1 Tax=Handroanthus impetiginosus TaxID=429701 RepID=A0A2G9GUB1_9LAMI|nr:Metacaspase involved in regulation of apoptosis [Handroanthus impetiginosus]